jgi:hypothetical protein
VLEGLVSKGVGGNWARDANINLFRAVLPQHTVVERLEDGATNFAASQDWTRLRLVFKLCALSMDLAVPTTNVNLKRCLLRLIHQ